MPWLILDIYLPIEYDLLVEDTIQAMFEVLLRVN